MIHVDYVLVKCGKPDCFRRVTATVVFCCPPCAVAAEGTFEVGQYHSEGCEERHVERGDYRGEVFERE